MSDHAYTPGPWSATPSESGEAIWIGNDDENAGLVPGYADHPRNIANARLMAAAPEFAAAVEAAMRSGRLCSADEVAISKGAFGALRDAYIKAMSGQ